MSKKNIIIYLIRRDLRVQDNPILHRLATTKDHGYTHLLPVYVFPPHQIEVSGFTKDGDKCPYPEARSKVGRYWRCGPHRARFIGESVWDMKENLESLGSGLLIRVGNHGEVVQRLVDGFKERHQNVGAVWITSEDGVEESRDEKAIAASCQAQGVDFQKWVDEKYYIDDRKLNFEHPRDLPDVFTTYRKSVEPLHEKPLPTLPRPAESSLPPFPDASDLPAQHSPFSIPQTLQELEEWLVTPVKDILPDVPALPDDAKSAHPFKGGESHGQDRLTRLIQTGAIKSYKDSRNGLIGTEFSTKLSAYLAQGCITARQVHERMAGYEDGTNHEFQGAPGFGEGENEGTKAVRFELLWRDYMRLCTKKFQHKLFRLGGFREDEADYSKEKEPKWKVAEKTRAVPNQEPDADRIAHILERFNAGTTGMGLIDASQRELIHTGYTSNRARQNVASFLAKHLSIDWRYGAEWYEMLLVDYDVSSNWANWQYVSGVGNDPRGEARIFNPVKQAFDYDKDGSYVRMWVPEVKDLERLENVFQVWTTPEEELKEVDLVTSVMVTDPVKKIDFSVEGKPRNPKRTFFRRRGHGRRPSQTTNGDSGTTNGSIPEAHQGENGHTKPQVQQKLGEGMFRGGYRGGNRGAFRGNRGFSTGRGGYRGRYAPGPGRAQWVAPGQPNA